MDKKRIVIVLICLVVGGLHLVTGENYQGPLPVFVNGYLIDILLPFSLYFLVGLFNLAMLDPWWARVLVPFGIGITVEAVQFLGVPIFGRTFDPLDFAAYAAGALLAALCDRVLFPHLFQFW